MPKESLIDRKKANFRGTTLDSGLRPNCLSFIEVLAQSVATLAPTAVPVMIAPLVFLSAGNGSCLAFLLALAGILAVGFCVNQFARRSASPGSVYLFVSKALGLMPGFLVGWSLLFAYLLAGMANLLGEANYASDLLTQAHLFIHPLWLMLFGGLLVWYLAYKDIKLSTRLMLVMELLSMSLIASLCLLVARRHQTMIDETQVRLQGVSFDGLRAGLTLAIFCFAGFESPTSLGDEAVHPHRTIPRAVLLSAIAAGLFYIGTTYFSVLGFHALNADYGKSTAPLEVLSHDVGLPVLGLLTSAGAMVSFLACALACLNVVARLIFTLGRQRVFAMALGVPHGKNGTPHRAVTLAAGIFFIIPAACLLVGARLVDVFGDVTILSTFGFLVAYLLVAIAAPVYLKSLKLLRPMPVLVSIAGVLVLLLPVTASFDPTLPWPVRWFPYFFIAYLLVGVGWLAVLRKGNPKAVETIANDLHVLYGKR